MTADRNIQIREATTSADDESIFALNLEYLTWATAELVEKYGISWPVDAGEVRKMLAKFKRPEGAIFLAEIDGEPVGAMTAAQGQRYGQVLTWAGGVAAEAQVYDDGLLRKIKDKTERCDDGKWVVQK